MGAHPHKALAVAIIATCSWRIIYVWLLYRRNMENKRILLIIIAIRSHVRARQRLVIMVEVVSRISAHWFDGCIHYVRKYMHTIMFIHVKRQIESLINELVVCLYRFLGRMSFGCRFPKERSPGILNLKQWHFDMKTFSMALHVGLVYYPW